jgi:hypothetical protein
MSGVDVGGHSDYEYFGGLVALAGPLSQSGPLVRIWTDRLSYDFLQGTRKVQAHGWGQSASLGYQLIYGDGSLAGYVGIDHRDTSMPSDIASREKGSQTGARLEADWFQRLTPTLKADVIGSLVTGTLDYWTRARVLYETPFQGVAVGPEVTWQGSPDYDAHRFGLGAELPVGRVVKATFDVGFEKISHSNGTAYGGLGLSVPF